jgi:hypothetical protein
MKYVVTDDFVAAHGWTPDKTAKALMEPLARVAYWSNELAVLASEALDRSTDATRHLKGKNLAGFSPLSGRAGSAGIPYNLPLRCQHCGNANPIIGVPHLKSTWSETLA